MVIGIKYITGSIEEKATYKKSMMPYIIGCVLLFGAATIAPEIIETFKDNQEIEDVVNTVLGLFRTIGTFVAIATIMILGIKYMLGSLEERATYKKSMMPFLIGAILLFAAVNITAIIAENFALDDEGYVENNGGTAPAPTFDFTERTCTGCGREVVPIRDAFDGRYECPRCGNPM